LITNLITVIDKGECMRLVLPVALVAVLLSGCATPAASDATIRIVASTNVYGDIAQTIGGDDVSVTSLISGAQRDPHSFEASALDQLAVSKADVIVANGGGYDPFVETLVAASASEAIMLTASEIVGLSDGANEHLWYDFESMDAVAESIANTLAELDPSNAPSFEANYAQFSSALAELAQAPQHEGGVAVTEPVPLYLLEAVGLVNMTPAAFTEAIEEGTDVPPAALQQTLALFETGSVLLLAYNEQTASPETERVRSAAIAAGIPIVDFSETLPEGETYLTWMAADLANLEAAL
jgi:zinc/manganese transport system substrate-binding protein